MIDLHCHLLPGIDDGPQDLQSSLRLARALVADGVEIVACTPHILPGVYPNTGAAIRQHIGELELALAQEGVELAVVAGSDNHVVADFIGGLRSGRLLTLAGSRYVLVEPPHHLLPPRLEDLFFDLLIAGYVPVLTHPERLTWISSNYEMIRRLAKRGVWMQLTAGSVLGAFGREPKYWSRRMLEDGIVHLLASDAHDETRRPPCMRRAREVIATLMGDREAGQLVYGRPRGVLDDAHPATLAAPEIGNGGVEFANADISQRGGVAPVSFAGRLRRFFE